MSMSLRASKPMLAIVFFAVVTSGCGSKAESTEPISSPSASATGVPADVVPTASTLGTTTNLKVRALPESALEPVPGFEYKRIPGGSDVPPEMETRSDIFEGSINRSIYWEGVEVGAISMVRFRAGFIADDKMAKKTLRDSMEDYAQTKDFIEEKMAGQTVLSAKNIRGTNREVAGWLEGDDLTIVFARETLSAGGLAAVYVKNIDVAAETSRS